ncbi:MAG: hypothetical protein E2O68_09200, partial [Deltaproteobacteria bacterium]
ISVKGALGHEIEFGSSDMKALLTMFMHINPGESKFLGSRCNLSEKDLKEKLERGEMTADEYGHQLTELVGPSCEGVNAGAFHIVLANQIKRDEGFVVDVTRDQEVWNQAVVGFSTQMTTPIQGATPGAAEGTVQEVYVKTAMYYIVEVPQSWEAGFNQQSIATKVYEYILELDIEGNILGGRWISNDRPDFMWTQSRPKFTKYFAPLEDLYIEATKHLNSLTWIRTVNRVMGLKEKLKKARAALKFKKLSLRNVRVNSFISNVKTKRRLTKLKRATKKLKIMTGLRKMVKVKAQLDESLLRAVDKGDSGEIISLVLKGADVNGKRFKLPQGSLLNKVIKKGNRAVVLAFMKAGAYLETGLVRSLEVGDGEIIDLFLKRRIGFNYKNTAGENALMIAAKLGNTAMIANILANFSQVNETDNNGRSALTLAILGMGMPPTPERVEIVKMLLAQNIDFSAKDNFNQTARDYADSFRRSPKRSHKKIKKLLKKAKKRARRGV